MDTRRIPPAGDPFTSAPAHPSTEESSVSFATRAERGLRLFEERGHRIHKFGTGLYRVPSCSGETFYTVDYLEERCTCPDFEHGHGQLCKHVYAVGLLNARRRGETLRRLEALEDQLQHEIFDVEERCELRDRVLRLRRSLGGVR